MLTLNWTGKVFTDYVNGIMKILFQSCIVGDAERRLNSSDKAVILPPVTEA